MSVFEITMLACFGAAWPMSIIKSARSKSTKGKSVLFNYFLLIGYAAGVLHKVFYSMDFVIILYALNFVMVATDTLLYYRNKRIEGRETQDNN